MDQNEINQRMLKAASLGLTQSLNNRGASDAQIQQALQDYPALLQKRAAVRNNDVLRTVRTAIALASGR